MLWFDSPFTKSVKNNFSKEFLKFVEKHSHSPSSTEICNCDTLKVSYSCMPNRATIVSSHNKNLSNNKQ